jgi:outer membrane protein TolC
MEWTQERLDALAGTVELLAEQHRDFERVVRQGFATLTELHADTQLEIKEMEGKTNQALQKLANSMSALTDHVADHGTRLDKLEGK